MRNSSDKSLFLLIREISKQSSLESISPPHRAYAFTTFCAQNFSSALNPLFCAGDTETFSNFPPLFFPDAARAFNLKPWCFRKALKADDEETLATASVRRQGGEGVSFDSFVYCLLMGLPSPSLQPRSRGGRETTVLQQRVPIWRTLGLVSQPLLLLVSQ